MPLITLTGPQTVRLQAALGAAFPTPYALETLLLTLNRAYQHIAVPAVPYPANVLLVIRAAQAEDWLDNLVRAARAAVPADPELRQLEHEIVPQAPPQHVNPFDVCRLSGGHVMVDRAPLRAALRDISQPLGKRILVIRGEKKTGKSHSLQLISHLRQTRGNFSVVFIDLETMSNALGPDALIEPWDLAQRLVRLMRYDLTLPERPKDAQWSRWVLEFCDAFEAQAQREPGQPWVVIDAFNAVTLAQPTFDLLKELATRVNASLTNFRFVLLGYGETFPAAVLPTVAEERISTIGQEHLVEFFFRAYTEMQVQFDEDSVADSVGRVLDGLDPANPDLVRLGSLITEELAKAASQGGGP